MAMNDVVIPGQSLMSINACYGCTVWVNTRTQEPTSILLTVMTLLSSSRNLMDMSLSTLEVTLLISANIAVF